MAACDQYHVSIARPVIKGKRRTYQRCVTLSICIRFFFIFIFIIIFLLSAGGNEKDGIACQLSVVATRWVIFGCAHV